MRTFSLICQPTSAVEWRSVNRSASLLSAMTAFTEKFSTVKQRGKKKLKNTKKEMHKMSKEATSSADWDDSEKSINNPEDVYLNTFNTHFIHRECARLLLLWLRGEITQNNTVITALCPDGDIKLYHECCITACAVHILLTGCVRNCKPWCSIQISFLGGISFAWLFRWWSGPGLTRMRRHT